MWRYKPFPEFLSHMVRLDVIGEVILINNDNSRTPDHPVLNHPKLRIFDFGKNIYVNPAWNLGVEESKYDNICFFSDDVIVDLKCFYIVDEFLNNHTTEEVGLIGICEGHHPNQKIPQTNGAIRIIHNIEAGINSEIGIFFFINKKNWIPIPDFLKIQMGDSWIDTLMNMQGKPRMSIVNCFFRTPWNTTTSDPELRASDVGRVDAMDRVLWQDYFWPEVLEPIFIGVKPYSELFNSMKSFMENKIKTIME
jgi:hypothetical protein